MSAAVEQQVALRPVQSEEEVESLRRIRNACRLFMTNSQAFIEPQAQRDWFGRLPASMRVYLLFVDEEAVGYGLLKQEGNNEWITGAVMPSHRGRGHGEYLFCQLIERCVLYPSIEVLRSNFRAQKLYHKLGFMDVGYREGTCGEVMVMRMPANLQRGTKFGMEATRPPETLPNVPLFRVTMAPEAADRVANVLASGYVGEGQEVKDLEQEFSSLVGAPRSVVAVNSCTSALTLALRLCGVKQHDWVISTPVTCSATNTPISNLGANILWADVDPDTGLIDPKSIPPLLQKMKPNGMSIIQPKAIIAVDWSGSSCDYEALKQFGVPVIQDAAHRVFALNGPAGDYVAWSLGPIKHLTCGDGGMLLTPEDKVKDAKLLRWYGLDRESKADFRCSQDIGDAGFKFHMNNISAAIGRANLVHICCVVSKHRANGARLAAAAGTVFDPFSDYWFFPMIVEDRAGFTKHMAERGVAVSQVHRRCDEHSCWQLYRTDLPGVDAFASRNVGLPCHSGLSEDDLCRIEEALASWR